MKFALDAANFYSAETRLAAATLVILSQGRSAARRFRYLLDLLFFFLVLATARFDEALARRLACALRVTCPFPATGIVETAWTG